MRFLSGLIVTALTVSATAAVAGPVGKLETGTLEEVAASDRQWTGVAVTADGRVFVNFPRWSADVPVSVGELREDGSVGLYPDSSYNAWKPGDEPAQKFVCVQSVYVDGSDRLWVLDPANPWMRGVVPGGAKLIRVDRASDTIARSYFFDETVAPPNSYLNDVRVDTFSETAFITDSGIGALVVVDLRTGAARRVLEGHPSVKAEDTVVEIGGRPLPFTVHSDGIALDPLGRRLYFQALTGRTMYRIDSRLLADAAATAVELAAGVEKFADSGVSDGLLWGPEGVFVSALEHSAVKRIDGGGRVSTVVRDERLAWPDSFSRAPDGSLWVTTSQIHLGPNPPSPYRIFRIVPDSD